MWISRIEMKDTMRHLYVALPIFNIRYIETEHDDINDQLTVF